MNENELCDAIRARMTEATDLLQLESDKGDGSIKPPQVVDGYLPPKRSQKNEQGEDIPDYPYIIVRPTAGQTNEQRMTMANVTILIGCYSEDFDGYKYCLLVLAVIRKALMEKPTIDKRFRLELPFEWNQPEEQPWPEWQLEITTRWSLATPQDIEPNEVI